MSEKLQSSGEKLVENIDTSVESEKNLERLRELAEQAEKDPLQKHVESLQQSAEQQAVSGKELNVGDTGREQAAQSFGITKDLKKDSYKRSLKRIQGQLPAPDRVFSRVVHSPVIEAVSNVAGKTVARPSAFLGGSFVALVGSAVLLYMTRQYGFTYNYAVIFLLFVSGFLLGLAIELLLKLTVHRHRS